ncbi:hypothetical protein [Anaerotignum propionicum]|uniref:Uncharacterized protein n=1 Tax=Anaerotignum propionicum DSM 1682 TaxID=991789 RepID=A0ABN4LB29_ANAPI|nr:hypothetical protein [Anaerotignum propionicum]AMJ40229.1 hypothetical protein CPRO_06260 [Anaerotignum propionicum DSM 1682]
MTTMVQNIGVPGEIAQQLTIDTMWDAWEYLCNYVSEDLTTLLQNAINNNSVDGVVQRLGNTADIGGTATAGTVMGKLNALTDFNWNYQMVQRVKSSAVTTIPAPVASGTQGTVSFGIEFDTPVPLDYIKINILSVPSGMVTGLGLQGISGLLFIVIHPIIIRKNIMIQERMVLEKKCIFFEGYTKRY